MGYIYKITNDVNGKIYVGKTEYSNPENRWKEHLRDYGRRKFEKRPLYEAMNKYGIEHFHFEVIEETNTQEDTCKREKYWIETMRTYIGFKDCNGYNATLGGDGKSYLNLDEEEIIKYHIEKSCYSIGKTAKHFNVDNGTIRNILKKNNVIWLHYGDTFKMKTYLMHGGIYKIDYKSKMIVDIYGTYSDADNSVPIQKKIYRACKNYHDCGHYACGYVWYYGKDLDQARRNGDLLDINHSWF